MPLLESTDASEALGPHFRAIHGFISGAWDEYQREYSAEQRAKHDYIARASIVNCLMWDGAVKYFSDVPGAKPHNLNGLKFFTLDDKYAIRFKKFGRDLVSCNQDTDQIARFRNQVSLDGIDAMHNLEAGYALNQAETAISCVFLVCPNGKHKNYWEMEIKASEAVTKVRDLYEKVAADDVVSIVKPRAGRENDQSEESDAKI